MSDLKSKENFNLPNFGTRNNVPEIIDLTLDMSEEEGEEEGKQKILEVSGEYSEHNDPLDDVTVIKVVSFTEVDSDGETATKVTERGEELADDNPETSSQFCMNSRIETESICDVGSKPNMLPTELPDPVQNGTSRTFDTNMPVLNNYMDYCELPNRFSECDMPVLEVADLIMDAEQAKNIFEERAKIWNDDCMKVCQGLQKPAGSDASKPRKMKFTKTMSRKSCHPGRDQRIPEVHPLRTAQQTISEELRNKHIDTSGQIRQTKKQKLSQTMSRNSPRRSVYKGFKTHKHIQQNNMEELRDKSLESDAETQKKNGPTKTHEHIELKDMQQGQKKVHFSFDASTLSEITCLPSAVLTLDEPFQHLVTYDGVCYEKLLQAADVQDIGYFCDKCSVLFDQGSHYRAHLTHQGQCFGSSDVLTKETTHCGSGSVIQMMEVQETFTQDDSVSYVSVDKGDDHDQPNMKSHHTGILDREYLNKTASVCLKGGEYSETLWSDQVLQGRGTSTQPTHDELASNKLVGRISGETASGRTGLDVVSPGITGDEQSAQCVSKPTTDIKNSGDYENKLKHSSVRKEVCQGHMSQNLCSQVLKGSQEKHGNPGSEITYDQQAIKPAKKLPACKQVLNLSKPLGKRGRKKKVQSTKVLPEVEVEGKKYLLRPRTQASCTMTALKRAVGEKKNHPQSKISVSCTGTQATVVDVEDYASGNLFYVCGSKCGYTTLFFSSFKVHVEGCLLFGSLSCIHCGFKGMTPEDLSRHMEAHLEPHDKMFRCTEESCVFSTDILMLLKAHLVDGHGGLSSYRCCVCEAVCEDLGGLVHHLEDNLVQVVWCRYCDAVACDLELVQRHGQASHQSKEGRLWTMDRLFCADRKRNGAMETYSDIPDFEPLQGRMVEAVCAYPSVTDVRMCETIHHFSLDSRNAVEAQVCCNEELFHDVLRSQAGSLSDAGEAKMFRSDFPSQQSIDEEVDNDVAEESDTNSEVIINLSHGASDLDGTISVLQSLDKPITSTSDYSHVATSVTSTESDDREATKSRTSTESDDRGATKPVTATESDNRQTTKPITSIESDGRRTTKPITATGSDDRRTTKPITSIESDGRRTTKPITSIESDGRRTTKPITSIESDGRRTTKPITSIESDGRRTTKPITSIESDGRRTTKPITSIESDGRRTTKPITATGSDDRRTTKPITSIESDDRQTTKPITSIESDNRQTTKPITSIESDGRRTTKPITSIESDDTRTTKPITSIESDHRRTTKPITSIESDDRRTTKPITATGSDHRRTTKPITSIESDDRRTTKPITSIESDNRQTTKPITSIESDGRRTTKPITSIESDDRRTTKPITFTDSDVREATKPITATKSDDRQAAKFVISTEGDNNLACNNDVINASDSMEKDSVTRGKKQRKTMTIPDGEYFTKALKCIACIFSSMSRKNFERHLKSCHPEIHIVVESSCSPSFLEVKKRMDEELEEALLWLYEDHDTCYKCCMCKRVICVKTVLQCHLLRHLKVNLGRCVVCDEITCWRPDHRKSLMVRTPRYIVEETKRSVQVLLGSVEQNGVPVFNLKPCLGTQELHEKLNHLSTFCRKRFHCSVCLSCHTSLYSIHKHILLKHLNMPTFTCRACDFSGSERYEVARHMHIKHPFEPLCLRYLPIDYSRHILFDVPGKRLHRMEYVLVHPNVSQKTSADRFSESKKCKRMVIAGKERGSQRKTVGVSHLRRQNKTKGSYGNDNAVLGEHQCSVCSFRTRLLRLLIEHKKEGHPIGEVLSEDMEEERNVWCGKMEVELSQGGGKSSVDGDAMATDVRTFYKCQTCNFRSESSDESINHLRSKKPVKVIIQCSHCPAVFGHCDSFTIHVDLHHKLQNYKYIQIPLETMVEEMALLKVKVKVYRCVFCSYRSVMRSRFENHLASHESCITGNLG